MVEVGQVGAAHHELRRRRGHRRADVEQVQPGVEARGHPRADVPAVLVGHAAPRLVAGLAGGGGGAAPPQLLSRPRVVGGDDAGLGARRRHAAPARDDLAVRDDRPRALVRGMGPVVEDAGLPDQLAGLRVEGEDVLVDAGVDDEVVVDGEVPVGRADAGHDALARVVGEVAAVLPEQVPRGGVDGLDDVARVRHVEDAVVDERRALLAAAGAERPRPHHPQVADVVPVDLVEGAVAPAVEGAAPHEPVVRRRRLQHLVGDGNELRGGLCEGVGGGGEGGREYESEERAASTDVLTADSPSHGTRCHLHRFTPRNARRTPPPAAARRS